MADYVSYYSGDQIDEAVSRALPGGALDTGKVSVGFGYGGTMPVIAINTNDDTDGTKFDEKLNAFLNDMGNSSVKQILFDDYPYLSSGRFVGTLYKNDARFAVLYGAGYGANDTIVIKRMLSGSWKPFEWVNPPMQLGKEYRTTERYQGKPVYAKLVNFGSLPNASSKSVAHNLASPLNMVDGKITDSNGSFITNYNIKNFAISTANMIIETETDMSGVSAYILLKYTKTTD